MKPRPNARVLAWMDNADQELSYISSVTLVEIRQGVELMDAGERRRKLDTWISVELPEIFLNRVLPVDGAVVDQCGRLLAANKRNGWNIGSMDAFIAATARVHRLKLATLNRKHFEKLGVELVEF